MVQPQPGSHVRCRQIGLGVQLCQGTSTSEQCVRRLAATDRSTRPQYIEPSKPAFCRSPSSLGASRAGARTKSMLCFNDWPTPAIIHNK